MLSTHKCSVHTTHTPTAKVDQPELNYTHPLPKSRSRPARVKSRADLTDTGTHYNYTRTHNAHYNPLPKSTSQSWADLSTHRSRADLTDTGTHNATIVHTPTAKVDADLTGHRTRDIMLTIMLTITHCRSRQHGDAHTAEGRPARADLTDMGGTL